MEKLSFISLHLSLSVVLEDGLFGCVCSNTYMANLPFY